MSGGLSTSLLPDLRILRESCAFPLFSCEVKRLKNVRLVLTHLKLIQFYLLIFLRFNILKGYTLTPLNIFPITLILIQLLSTIINLLKRTES